ncbi:hypothetical protein T260_13480 [Geobacillus thermopakistaniensis]|uniref:Polysaccharide biosynthesis protein C-terminal domain-containing protein n=1 Tax=Geobacillus thermopakistaniensis (strain MAS1) TaxID=1408282 RepID=A0A7U9J9S3_GEOTM|nr:lipopolysaccharide biosynthesis protein [Geobacillus sp. MAS1]ESU71411.1 hypothetical protein T260_13480 [Geobacillus sp. MAS1]
MNNYIKQFIKTSAVFFIGNTLTKLTGFFLLPLYTSKIDPQSYGYYDLTISLINLSVPIIFFQVWDSIFRFTFEYEKKSDKYMVISNGIIILFSGLLLYIALFFILTNSFKYDIDYKYFIFMYGMLYAFQYFYNCVARSFFKDTLLVATGIFNSVIGIVLNIILIAIYDMGIEALYISYIIGTSIQLLVLEKKLMIINNFRMSIVSFRLMRELFVFALPLCIVTLSYWLLSGLTRLTISNELGIYENGLYGVANRLSSIIVFVVNVFQFAWYQMSYSMQKDSNKKEYYEYSLNYILKVILYVGSLGLILIKVAFPYLIAETYQGVLIIIPITFIGVLVNSYTSFASTLFLAEKGSNKLLMPTLMSAAVNILGLILFTKTFGLIGAIFSLTLAFFVNSLIITNKLNKQYNIDLNAYDLLKGLLVLTITLLVFYTIEETYYLIIFALFLVFLSMYIFKDTFKLLFNLLRN